VETGDWTQARLGAGILLALYVGLAAVFAGRELRFLAGVEKAERRLFAVQDILIQLALLGVLLPCVLAAAPNRQVIVVILVAFTLLWIVALWTVISRYMYTYRLMIGLRGQQDDFRRQLEQLTRPEDGDA
jgi:phosphatidylglycerophosphate synthase